MLKLDFHLHTNQGPYDTWVRHSPYDLIDRAAELDFDVLCFTHHGDVVFQKAWLKYAEDKGILLIPGTEAYIHSCHVLLINFTQEEAEQIKEFKDLKKFKDDNHLIIAPHPFLPSPNDSCIGKLIYRYKDCFDCLEYSSFFTDWLNWNKKGEEAALELGLPMVASTDCHHLDELGKTYTLVESKKNPRDIFKAIRSNKVRLVKNPHSTYEILLRAYRTVIVGGIHNMISKFKKRL